MREARCGTWPRSQSESDAVEAKPCAWIWHAKLLMASSNGPIEWSAYCNANSDCYGLDAPSVRTGAPSSHPSIHPSRVHQRPAGRPTWY